MRWMENFPQVDVREVPPALGTGSDVDGVALCAAVLFVSLALTLYARADPIADFYKGRTVTLIVGYGPGGGYDLYARLMARHLGRYISGNPTIVVQNMPGYEMLSRERSHENDNRYYCGVQHHSVARRRKCAPSRDDMRSTSSFYLLQHGGNPTLLERSDLCWSVSWRRSPIPA
jgi:hypothetical protein